MTTILLAAALALLTPATYAQQQVSTTLPALRLSELDRRPWPHIGSPPPESVAPATAERWDKELANFRQVFEAIKSSWTGEEVASAGDLKFRVQQYENLLSIIGGAGGYGNVILADCLRRLSLTLLIEYALAHPSENDTIAEIFKLARNRILDSPAVGIMLAEELKLAPRGESWRLCERRDEIDLVFRANGSTSEREGGRILFGLPSASTLMNRRDVNGVLLRAIESDTLASVHLPGLIEFRKLGGRLEDLDPNDYRKYARVMERDMRRFHFPAAGIPMLLPEHLGSLIEGFDPHGKLLNTFTKRALD